VYTLQNTPEIFVSRDWLRSELDSSRLKTQVRFVSSRWILASQESKK